VYERYSNLEPSEFQCNMPQFIHSSMTLQSFVGPSPIFSFLTLYTVGRTLGRGICPSQGRYLHTGQQKHRINVDIEASIRIRTHDSSIRASEDTSCLRPCGHCDRHMTQYRSVICIYEYSRRHFMSSVCVIWTGVHTLHIVVMQ
jgi:hypothetical protein